MIFHGATGLVAFGEPRDLPAETEPSAAETATTSKERRRRAGRPIELNAETRQRIFSAVDKGEKVSAIAKELNDAGIPTATERGPWYPSTVRAVIKSRDREVKSEERVSRERAVKIPLATKRVTGLQRQVEELQQQVDEARATIAEMCAQSETAGNEAVNARQVADAAKRHASRVVQADEEARDAVGEIKRAAEKRLQIAEAQHRSLEEVKPELDRAAESRQAEADSLGAELAEAVASAEQAAARATKASDLLRTARTSLRDIETMIVDATVELAAVSAGVSDGVEKVRELAERSGQARMMAKELRERAVDAGGNVLDAKERAIAAKDNLLLVSNAEERVAAAAKAAEAVAAVTGQARDAVARAVDAAEVVSRRAEIEESSSPQ